ncbi:MAG: outer membrane protein assembly factor BamD [Kiritimatiellaeota bacterium]|nr:outer membrane protein assembly factor BamD [Kiritimatiellota bacterium]
MFIQEKSGRADFARAAAAALAVAAALGSARAQHAAAGGGGQGREERPRYESADAPEFKEKGFIFGRPAKGAPEEQLAHAAALEAAGNIRSAARAYNALVSEWPTSEHARAAQLKVAEMYAKRGRALDAFREYQYFIEKFAGADDADFKTAITRQYALANAELARLDKGAFSSSDPDNVADMFRKIIANAPDWEHAAECQFKRGAAYEHKRDWLDAAFAYEALVTRYPDSGLRTDALYRSAFARVKLSDKYPRDERIMKNAIHSLRMAHTYDASHDSAADALKHNNRLTATLTKMNFEKAEFYDKIRKKPEAAIIAYKAFAKEFDGSPEAEKALKRVAELEKSLKPKTENE